MKCELVRQYGSAKGGQTRKSVAAVFALVLPVAIGMAQEATPQFEVTSVKPDNSGASASSIRVMPGGRLVAVNASLRSLITAAYQVRDFQLSGGPAWLDSARFDIDARGTGAATSAAISQMLQALLADRFALRIRRDTKELPVYALLVAKNGPKLEPSRAECFDPSRGVPPPAASSLPCGGFNMAGDRMAGAKVTMSHFAATLARILGRSVVDKTGLDGSYDITLRWTPDETQAFLAAGGPPPADSSVPSIFTAIQEQLGLRIESQKGPVEVLVIENAEKPSEN